MLLLEKEDTNKERGKARMNPVVPDWTYRYGVIVYYLHTHTHTHTHTSQQSKEL